MIVLSVLMFPAMYVRYSMGMYEMLLIDVPFFFAATWSVAYFYMVCQRELYPDTWTSRLKYLPFLMSIGIGLAVNNARAVIEALMGKQTEFARTPKYGIERHVATTGPTRSTSSRWRCSRSSRSAWASTSPFTVFYALANGIYGSLPFLVLFQVGFLYTGLLSLVQQFGGDDVVLDTQVAKRRRDGGLVSAHADAVD